MPEVAEEGLRTGEWGLGRDTVDWGAGKRMCKGREVGRHM